jgi:hypothetical protein
MPQDKHGNFYKTMVQEGQPLVPSLRSGPLVPSLREARRPRVSEVQPPSSGVMSLRVPFGTPYWVALGRLFDKHVDEELSSTATHDERLRAFQKPAQRFPEQWQSYSNREV